MRYNPFPDYVFRTPLFPFKTVSQIYTWDSIRNFFSNKIPQEALYLASPVLYTELQKWITGELSNSKEVEKLQLALLRYLLRMSCRCTPFGLFAGCSTGLIGDTTNIELQPQDTYKRHTRLDMNYLCALAENLARHPVIKPYLLYFPNSGVYASGDKLRYVEYRFKNKSRTHHLVAIDNSEYIQAVLQTSQNGASINTLTQMLCNMDVGIAIDEAQMFIEEYDFLYKYYKSEMARAKSGISHENKVTEDNPDHGQIQKEKIIRY